jgi:predicted dehydrogenase
VRVLQIGLGRWGQNHFRVWRELGVELAVADPAPERRAWAVAHGLEPERAFAHFRDALDGVDAVDVVTPADSHLALAEACLKVGRHCFVEKPLAMTVVEGRQLATRAGEAGRVLQVGHIFRFHAVTAALRAELGGGRLGAVRFVTGRFAGFKRPRTDVGVTQTDAIHYFDLFAHLLATPAVAVSAFQRDHLGRGLDDLSVTVVRYGDVPAIVEADYFVPETQRQCVIVGERGTVVADYRTGGVAFHAGEHRRSGSGWDAVEGPAERSTATGEEPLRAELCAFLQACDGRHANPVPADDGVHALEIVEAAARSSHLRREVLLSELR